MWVSDEGLHEWADSSYPALRALVLELLAARRVVEAAREIQGDLADERERRYPDGILHVLPSEDALASAMHEYDHVTEESGNGQ